MAKKTIRFYSYGKVWVAKKDGTTKASAIRNTQKEAYMAARNIALNQGLTITVYYPTGGIDRVVNPRDSADDNCFISTACVKYYGLEDKCYELQTLRFFRDYYLLKSSHDFLLVQQYYTIAPLLVQKLESDKNRGILFKKIFYQITKACEAIEARQFEKAKAIYCNTIEELLNHYKTN